MKVDELKMLILAVALVLLTMAAFQRNAIWVTKLSLWTDVASKTPAKSRVRNSLGNCYMLLGDYFHAVEEYKAAIALDNANYEAYYNIANNLERIGLGREALGYYAFFCRAAPRDYPEATRTACERAARLTREFAAPGN